jgi:BON domain
LRAHEELILAACNTSRFSLLHGGSYNRCCESHARFGRRLNQMGDSRSNRSRIVVDASPRPRRQPARGYGQRPRNTEVWLAVSLIIAAALATFLALFLTSRPYDPMSASLAPQQIVPAGPSISPSPKPSATASPTPQTAPSPSLPSGETSPAVVDDATIQAEIDKTLAADSALANLDVSTLVENGKVTIVGSVKSSELKQRVAREIRALKGVISIDNQLVVAESTPQ